MNTAVISTQDNYSTRDDFFQITDDDIDKIRKNKHLTDFDEADNFAIFVDTIIRTQLADLTDKFSSNLVDYFNKPYEFDWWVDHFIDVSRKDSDNTEIVSKEFFNLFKYNTKTYTPSISYISDMYILRDKKEVVKFLHENIYLNTMLDKANFEIRKYFGLSKNIIQLIVDPEGKEEYLSIFIQTTLSPKDAFLKLTEFDKKWWNNIAKEAKGKLDINVEFI